TVSTHCVESFKAINKNHVFWRVGASRAVFARADAKRVSGRSRRRLGTIPNGAIGVGRRQSPPMHADPSTPPPMPQPLRRAASGRWLGGVCRGIATRWGVPVMQVRMLFAVAAVLGGVGALAYVACWLVLPADGADD